MTLNTMYLHPDYGPWVCKNLAYLGGLMLVVPLACLNATLMMLEHPSRSYTKCAATPGSNDWTHMTLNTMHLDTDYGRCLCQNLAYLGWFNVCGSITMAQGQCNNV